MRNCHMYQAFFSYAFLTYAGHAFLIHAVGTIFYHMREAWFLTYAGARFFIICGRPVFYHMRRLSFLIHAGGLVFNICAGNIYTR